MSKSKKYIGLKEWIKKLIQEEGGGDSGGGESVLIVPIASIAQDNTVTFAKHSFDDLKQAWEDRKQIILTSVGDDGPFGYAGLLYNLVGVTFKRNETGEKDMENDEIESFQFVRIAYDYNVSYITGISEIGIVVMAEGARYNRMHKDF